MNILQINSSARAEGSHSTRLANVLVERVKASLTFEKAGKVDIELDVEAVGGAPKEHKH